MKKIFNKRIIALFIGICIIFSTLPAYADSEVESTEPSIPALSERIPVSVSEFIYGNFSDIEDVVRSRFADVSLEKEILLGNPYIVYNFSEYQDEVYYYPLIVDGKIAAVLGVIGTDWGYTYEISYDCGLIELLEEMDYLNNDCIFYTMDGELYYESENGVNAEPVITMGYSTVQMPDADELAFAAMSFEEKQSVVTDKLDSFRYVDTQSFDGNEPVDMKYGAMKAITLRKPQSQYAYNMCWACVVATIVNTLNWTSYTGYDVCNRMGIGFNTGAEIEEIRTALSYYGINYKKTADALGWDKIKQNIDAGYPIAMIMNPYYATSDSIGHSITLYGYNQTSKNKYIEIWNSQSEFSLDTSKDGYSDEFNYSNIKILLIPPEDKNNKELMADTRGYAYIWVQTLSEYN